MSPAPHAPCRGQHCPVVAMLLAPRSNPLPIPEKTGWVGGRKNARAAWLDTLGLMRGTCRRRRDTTTTEAGNSRGSQSFCWGMFNGKSNV